MLYRLQIIITSIDGNRVITKTTSIVEKPFNAEKHKDDIMITFIIYKGSASTVTELQKVSVNNGINYCWNMRLINVIFNIIDLIQ